MRLVCGLVLLLGLAGCAGIFHSSARQEQVYFLSGKSGGGAESARSPTRGSIRVGRPTAAPGLDSSHIVLLESSHRMSFFSASRWPSALPEVLETLAAQALNSVGSFASVQTSASPFPSDYLLQIRIRRFEADYTGGSAAPEIHVVLDCTLGRRSGREIVQTFTAEASANATANRLGEVVTAFEEATNAALDSMSTRVAGAVRDDADQNVDSPVPSMKR